MRIGVLADTHDNLPKIAQAVELFNREKVELVLHAGDFVSPFTAGEFKRLRARLIGVFGNNDGDRLYLLERYRGIGELYDGHHELELAGRRVALMHKPDLLEALIASERYDLIVYGHTHMPELREGRPLVLNPGEAGGWTTGRATVAIVDLAAMKAELVELGQQ
jgi:putative phosphoesterase